MNGPTPFFYICAGVFAGMVVVACVGWFITQMMMDKKKK